MRRATPRLASATSKGVRTSPQQVDCGNGWQALGFSTTSIERASGQHNANLLVIVDEASGVDDEIWDAIRKPRIPAGSSPSATRSCADGRFISLIRQADQDARDGIPPRLGTNAIQIPSTDSPHADLKSHPGESPIEPGSTPVIAGTDCAAPRRTRPATPRSWTTWPTPTSTFAVWRNWMMTKECCTAIY